MLTLPMARYRFRVRMHDTLKLPEFSGSLMRSVFGSALKRLACSNHEKQPCTDQCAYRRLFDPERPEQGRFPENPPPYVIQPPRQTLVEAGQCLQFSMVLMGKALEDFPIVVQAWQQALAAGLGKKRVTGQLLDITLVNEEQPQRVYSSLDCQYQPHKPEVLLPADYSGSVTMNLLTPLRLQQQKQFIKPQGLTTEMLAKALLRRTRLAGEVYLDLKSPDWHQFAQWFEPVTMQSELNWQTVERYSSRQKQSMKLGGLLGVIRLNYVPAELQPWLKLGEYLHLGKNSSFGLGQYYLSVV
ncbi:CRISPR system precrRNA processing endoribonuclease RAMP protein Cas6 [Endozoicomonas sp. 2B-B]